jgi:phosphoribosyl-ATP pyrophosphohydrolase/phosphoribosyl-AMP cyclohydrolase
MNATSPSPALPIKFDANGLVPVIVQDHLTGEVRMFAYANDEAIRRTLASRKATFFSRSRNELWEKGQTSGNEIQVLRILVDCDADCLIYATEPKGPSCHTGAPSCFFRALEGGELVELLADGRVGDRSAADRNNQPVASGPAESPYSPDRGTKAEGSTQTLLGTLEGVLEARKTSTGRASYTKTLYDGGASAIGAKISEEAGELVQALAEETDDRVVSETADLLYHAIVGLRWRSIPFRRVLFELARRFGRSGHEEKASR